MGQQDLFGWRLEEGRRGAAPLADRMRPRTLDEVVGQEDVLGPGSLLRRAVEEDHVFSMILWGPPGTGKTTVARLLATLSKARFESFSAVTSGIKEVREFVARARERLALEGTRTILFVDEIHRFNKTQQDAFLPHIEDGTIIFVGATTENPSFELNSALLSRARVLVLKALSEAEISVILARALTDPERGLGAQKVVATDEALAFLSRSCAGDARRALNALETAVVSVGPGGTLDERVALQALERAQTLYDKDGEQHYDLISALHKSLRSSDPQAGLYWLARMLAGGEDPLFIVRRLVRFASEDVGLADPQALTVALAAKDTVEFVGLPECDCALAEAVVYLATAPKSNALYRAIAAAKQVARDERPYAVPLHLRNAPTKLMDDLGYGHGYRYDHDDRDGFSGQECMPDELRGRTFYTPGRFGFERDVAKRLDYWAKLRTRKGPPDQGDAT